MGRKKKVNIENKIRVKNIKGVEINGVIFSYDISNEFIEAWPGIKMWLDVEANNRSLKQ